MSGGPITTRQDFLSLVGRLGEKGRGEDQLSNAFAACFNESPAFRDAAVRLILNKHGKHRHQFSEHPGAHYECVTQQSNAKGGILDLVLRPRGRHKVPTLTLESKLGAPLTEEQLLRYCAAGANCLTAITKHLPNVSLRWLRNHSIRWLRWHEMHAALVWERKQSAIDRFICSRFSSYLESRRMSSRSITRRDLESIAATFRVIAQPRPFGAVTSLGFAVAAELLELLKEAKWELEDLLSTKRSIAGWGPGYFNLGDDGVRDHHLGFELFRARTSRKPPRFRLLSAFVFPTGRNQRIRWQVYAYDYLSWESIGGCELDQPADRLLDRSGHLTCDRLVDSVADCVRKWRPAFL